MVDLLHTGQIAVGVFAVAGAALLGYMLKTGADGSSDRFSARFMRYASVAMALIAVGTVFLLYRAIRLPTEQIPLDAAAGGLIGYLIIAIGLWSVVGYLVRGNGKPTG
jgi:hypothetical protein